VSAVHYCHDKGIVLRDLKMGRFVFTDNEKKIVKLETLEDAAILSDYSDDRLSDKHGCPNYVSPEKADILRSNGKYPGKATDIWGLGVILYTMLVGRYPFNDAEHTKLFLNIRKGHFSIPDYLSHSVKCLLRSLLRKDPSRRLTCQEVLEHPWVKKISPGFQSNEGGTSRYNRLERYIHSIGNSVNTCTNSTQLSQLENIKLNETNDQVVPDIDS
jgi:tribbles-like protein